MGRSHNHGIGPRTDSSVGNVRALGGIVARAGRFFHDFDFEAYGNSLWREALRVVAGLVAQDAVHYVLTWYHGMQWMYRDGDREISGVDVESVVGRKGEGQILPGGIVDLAQDDVSGQIHL